MFYLSFGDKQTLISHIDFDALFKLFYSKQSNQHNIHNQSTLISVDGKEIKRMFSAEIRKSSNNLNFCFESVFNQIYRAIVFHLITMYEETRD